MKQEIQERINGHIEYLKKNDSDVEIYVEPKDNVRIMKQALDGYCISIPAIAEYTDNLGDGWLSTLVLANDYISMVFIYHSEECRKLFKEVE